MVGITGQAARPASRRRIMAGFAALVGTGAMAACAPGAPAADVSKSKEPVTLRWSTWGDANNPFNSQGIPMGMPLFKQKFPKITVQPEVQLCDWPQ